MVRMQHLIRILSLLVVIHLMWEGVVQAKGVTESTKPTIDSISDLKLCEDGDTVFVPLEGISCGLGSQASGGLDIKVKGVNCSLLSCVLRYFDGNSKGSLAVKPVNNAFGSNTLEVILTNSEGSTTKSSFVVTVDPVNDAPYVKNPVPNKSIAAGDRVEIPISPVPGVIFDDPDDSVLSCILCPEDGRLPTCCRFDGSKLIVSPCEQDTGVYRFVVKAFDRHGASGADTFEVVVESTVTTLVNREMSSQLNIYPNPSKGLVRVDVGSNIMGSSEVVVRSITGAQVLRQSYDQVEGLELDLSDQANGVYLVFLEMEGQKVVRKIVLER